MAFIFLEDNDLKSHILEQFLTERSEETPQAILETLEKQNIAIIKSKLKGRYDIEAIFTADAGERHWLIKKILIKLVLYDFVRRNAARKVPSDYVKEWEWAMKILEQIKSGKETPDGLPTHVNEDGSTGRVIYGSRTNRDNHI